MQELLGEKLLKYVVGCGVVPSPENFLHFRGINGNNQVALKACYNLGHHLHSLCPVSAHI